MDSTPQSRRALLGALAGGLGAFVAGALGRPERAAAANHDAVKLGENSKFDGSGLPYTSIFRTDAATGVDIAGDNYGLHANTSEARGAALSGYNFAADSNDLLVISRGDRATGVLAPVQASGGVRGCLNSQAQGPPALGTEPPDRFRQRGQSAS